MNGILKYKDSNGNWVDFPAFRGEKGEKGDQGIQGIRGEKGDSVTVADVMPNIIEHIDEKFVTLTQIEFDDLAEKDPNTTYYIVEEGE